jgi:uncharacterized damage-inducible protein DinB
MSAETARLADQLRRSYHGSAWHGPSLSELLAGLTIEQASARPLAGAHSIHEIVEHIAFWERKALEALRGSPMPEEGDDWPSALQPWDSLLAELRKVTDDLTAAIEGFPTARLENIVLGRTYTFEFLMHGIVQDNLYHAGQIALLKKGK